METIPAVVSVLWWIGIGLAFVVFIPLALYWLHRTWRAARTIHRYAGEALTAAAGIAGATAQLPVLDTTAAVASDMVASSDAVARKLETIARVLSDRAGRRA